MTYNEGIIFIKNLFELHKVSNIAPSKIEVHLGKIILETPGYKEEGDYKVFFKTNISSTPKAYSHADIVQSIYDNTTSINASRVIESLEAIFLHGLNCNKPFYSTDTHNLLFWLTLQEDLNYPMPRYQGRKLPYQRYFEAVLAKLNFCTLDDIKTRTNNHKAKIPELFQVPKGIKHPLFYDLNYKCV